MRAAHATGDTLVDFDPRDPAAPTTASPPPPSSANYLFAALAGVIWYFQFFFYSMGQTKMGNYDFSSWTLHMASIIIFATLWGLVLKEWKGTSRRTKILVACGLILLVSSTVHRRLRQLPQSQRNPIRLHPGRVTDPHYAMKTIPRILLSVVALTLSLATASAQSPGTAPPETPAQPALTQAQNPPLNPSLPTLFLVGDSTARNGADLGWGDHFAHFFDTSRINVANRARAGRSSRTFLNEGAWDKVLAEMKPGDYVLLQMGHNDGGDLDGAKPRGTLKGLGDETKDVTLPDGHHETVHTYGWYLRRYIADTRAHQATPILLTLTVRNIWKDGRIERDMGYDAFLQQLAAVQHVPLIDMGHVAADNFEALGQEKTALLFPKDHTHTSSEGAELNAEAVVAALRIAHSPLVAYLRK